MVADSRAGDRHEDEGVFLMNRRSFLARLGVAAVGAAAITLDPEQLLWIPGAKTIIDFGATKQVLPATDAEVVHLANVSIRNARGRDYDLMDLGPRDIRLTIGSVDFLYRGERLISQHSAEELRLLDKPFFNGPSGWWDVHMKESRT